MATELIASGSTAATSADIVVADGESVTIALKNMNGFPTAQIQLKDSAAAYHDVGALGPSDSAKVIIAPGTYRIFRPEGSVCGVFRG